MQSCWHIPEMAIACTKLPFSFLYQYHLLNIVKQRYRDVWGVFVCINMNLFVTWDLHRAHILQKQLKVMIICWIREDTYIIMNLFYVNLVCLCFCLTVSILACKCLLPQFLKSLKSSFVSVTSSPSRTSCSGRRLDVPTAPKPWSPTWSTRKLFYGCRDA